MSFRGNNDRFARNVRNLIGREGKHDAERLRAQSARSRGCRWVKILEPLKILLQLASTRSFYLRAANDSHGELADHGGDLVSEQLVK